MKIRDSFFIMGLLIGTYGVLQGAQADDFFDLTSGFDDEMDLLVLETEAIAMERAALAVQVELVQQQRDKIEQDRLNEELLQTVYEGREDAVALVKDLIARGADVTFADKDGWIPLHYAVHNRYIPELVEVLIRANFDSVNYQTKARSTPLHIAIWSGQGEEIIKALLDAQADPDFQNNEEITPRDLAIEYECEHLLPERGARTKPAISPSVLRK